MGEVLGDARSMLFWPKNGSRSTFHQVIRSPPTIRAAAIKSAAVLALGDLPGERPAVHCRRTPLPTDWPGIGMVAHLDHRHEHSLNGRLVDGLSSLYRLPSWDSDTRLAEARLRDKQTGPSHINASTP